ncbi:unnamed protein product [Nippostrongylus brasiliensis]|uniref:DUF4314 domain-containing protein n=1 Tax=Nippostrongylus brasiliensis TaxID=27835 RepID=A0A0N4XKA1_NIPBR|nr:unnamed protein product [Nippostrongylus brasiliensis]
MAFEGLFKPRINLEDPLGIGSNENVPIGVESWRDPMGKRDPGVYCEMVIPEHTFKDVEDGDTFKLRLTVQPIGRKVCVVFENRLSIGSIELL